MEERLSEWSALILAYGLNAIVAVLIFFVGRFIAIKLTNALEHLMVKRNVDEALTGFLKNLTYVALMAFVIIAVMSRLGIQTASFIAVIGAAGLAVGMALQGSLSNFAAGVMIILFKPLKIGQFIAAGGEKGTVKEIGIFNTTLFSPDNVKIIVPNAQLISGSITNYSANDTRRVDLTFGIAYGDDIRKAKEVFAKALNAETRILKDPAPVVAVSGLGDSSVNFAVRPWVKSTEYWDVYFALTENIKLELERNGLTIPFPQRDVHVYQESKTSNHTLAGTASR